MKYITIFILLAAFSLSVEAKKKAKKGKVVVTGPSCANQTLKWLSKDYLK